VADATAAATQAPSGANQRLVTLTDDFEDPASSVELWTGVYGDSSATVEDGAYHVSTTAATGWPIMVELGQLPNAEIRVDIRIDGDGSAGVFGRLNLTPSKTLDSEYGCYLRGDQSMWCEYASQGIRHCLCALKLSEFDFSTVNTLELAIAGDTVQVSINGTIISTQHQDASSDGWWGLYVDAPHGTRVDAWFDNLVVTQLPDDYALPTPVCELAC